MKLRLKIIFLLLFLFFVSGCGWSDIQKDYGEILKENISCTYVTAENNSKKDFFGIETIELSVDYDGFYASFGEGKLVVFNKDGVKNYVSANNYQFNFSNEFLKDYFKKYQEKNACPELLSITKDYQKIKMEACENEDDCSLYNLKTNTITTKNGIKKNCHHSLAINCQKFSKEKDEHGEKAYIEIGYYEVGGNVKKYFGVSSDENFKNIVIDDDESDGFSIYQNTEGFDVPKDAINEIWISNNRFLTRDFLQLKASYTSFTTYFLTGSPTSNPGTLESGVINIEPNLDSDSCLSDSIIEISTRLNYDNVCYNSGVLRTFWIIGTVLKIIKWLVPFIIIILGMIDFGKASFSNDDKAINIASQSLLKRIIAGLLIFIIPTIMGVLTKTLLSYNIFDDNNDFISCTDCMFNSDNCGETVKILAEQEKVRDEQKKQSSESIQVTNNKYTKEEIIAMDQSTVANMSNEEFIEFMGSAARVVYSEYGGVLPSITVAQAILESGYGNSIVSTTHNPYGLIGYPGEKPKVGGLRKFDNFYESTYYHYLYFQNYSGVYASFLNNCDNNNPLEAATSLYAYAGGSSTYSPKIIQLINQYNLIRFDK